MSRSDRQSVLLASIHDVSPKFEREIETLYEKLARHTGEGRLAMLVVPDHWGSAPLADAPDFRRKLRAWADAGVEMFVHGWFHRDASVTHGIAGLKARHMTAGEGEFLGLDHATALARMRDGKALVEEVTGKAAAGFIAPAWLYGEGAQSALAEAGFALAEDHFRVWQPTSGRTLARGPVITWASRSRARTASSLFFAGLARHALGPLPVARVAVHPGDTGVPAIMASIDATLARLMRGRTAGRYSDLLARI